MAPILALTALVLLAAIVPAREASAPAGGEPGETSRLDPFLLDDQPGPGLGPTVAATRAIAGPSGGQPTADATGRPRGGPAGSTHRSVH